MWCFVRLRCCHAFISGAQACLPSLVTVVLDGVFCDFEIAAVFFQMNNVQNVFLPVASFVVIL